MDRHSQESDPGPLSPLVAFGGIAFVTVPSVKMLPVLLPSVKLPLVLFPVGAIASGSFAFLLFP